jgi:hypothetical protein
MNVSFFYTENPDVCFPERIGAYALPLPLRRQGTRYHTTHGTTWCKPLSEEDAREAIRSAMNSLNVELSDSKSSLHVAWRTALGGISLAIFVYLNDEMPSTTPDWWIRPKEVTRTIFDALLEDGDA